MKNKRKKNNNFLEGIVDHVNKRYCFIECEKLNKDVKVFNFNMKGAIHKDKVLFSLNNKIKNEGKVIKVLERDRNIFVGKVEDNKDFAFFIPDSKNIYTDFFIKKNNKEKYDKNIKVLAKVTNWNTIRKPEANIIKILGRTGENETEINSIIYEYDLNQNFPKDVIHEVDNINTKIDKSEINKRKDIRKLRTFTIDPSDAKDFDDALSFHDNKDGFFNVGIHIADVSHFFDKNSSINKEAEKRATSVYLVDRTIPMLPEKLSNYLCSLRPNSDRLTFSVMFDINIEAEIKNIWIGKTIIHSEKRFTYEEAQKCIEKGEDKFSKGLKVLNTIGKRIREKRFKNGSFNFKTNEVKFILDENKKPINIYEKKRKDSHKMIEEYMLLANKIVAEKVQKIKNKKNPFVYRIHEEPKADKLEELKNYIAQFGYKINTEEKMLSKSLNDLMQKIKGKPEENSIEKFAIRSMSKAKYSINKEKHFGLSFNNYTHFTSPIRRFPDVMVHRLLNHYLNNKFSEENTYYEILCKHSTKMEILATKAERESIKFKQVEYMSNFIDKDFDGIISGINEWGIFVELIETKCEGLIKLSSIKDDFFDFDNINMQIIGKRSKKKFKLGEQIKVKVIETNIEKRTIDLELL